MRMERERLASGPMVTGFGPGGFRVENSVFPALLLTVKEATPWTPPPLGELDLAAIELLLDPLPEFVLLGTGATLARPPRALVAALEAAGVGIEPMDSRAAARAWGVLRGEDRAIAAALYPLG